MTASRISGMTAPKSAPVDRRPYRNQEILTELSSDPHYLAFKALMGEILTPSEASRHEAYRAALADGEGGAP